MLLLSSYVPKFLLLLTLLLCEAALGQNRRPFLGFPGRGAIGGSNSFLGNHRGNLGRGFFGGLGRRFQPLHLGSRNSFQRLHGGAGRRFHPKYQEALRRFHFQPNYRRTGIYRIHSRDGSLNRGSRGWQQLRQGLNYRGSRFYDPRYRESLQRWNQGRGLYPERRFPGGQYRRWGQGGRYPEGQYQRWNQGRGRIPGRRYPENQNHRWDQGRGRHSGDLTHRWDQSRDRLPDRRYPEENHRWDQGRGPQFGDLNHRWDQSRDRLPDRRYPEENHRWDQGRGPNSGDINHRWDQSRDRLPDHRWDQGRGRFPDRHHPEEQNHRWDRYEDRHDQRYPGGEPHKWDQDKNRHDQRYPDGEHQRGQSRSPERNFGRGFAEVGYRGNLYDSYFARNYYWPWYRRYYGAGFYGRYYPGLGFGRYYGAGLYGRYRPGLGIGLGGSNTAGFGNGGPSSSSPNNRENMGNNPEHSSTREQGSGRVGEQGDRGGKDRNGNAPEEGVRERGEMERGRNGNIGAQGVVEGGNLPMRGGGVMEIGSRNFPRQREGNNERAHSGNSVERGREAAERRGGVASPMEDGQSGNSRKGGERSEAGREEHNGKLPVGEAGEMGEGPNGKSQGKGGGDEKFHPEIPKEGEREGARKSGEVGGAVEIESNRNLPEKGTAGAAGADFDSTSRGGNPAAGGRGRTEGLTEHGNFRRLEESVTERGRSKTLLSKGGPAPLMEKSGNLPDRGTTNAASRIGLNNAVMNGNANILEGGVTQKTLSSNLMRGDVLNSDSANIREGAGGASLKSGSGKSSDKVAEGVANANSANIFEGGVAQRTISGNILRKEDMLGNSANVREGARSALMRGGFGNEQKENGNTKENFFENSAGGGGSSVKNERFENSAANEKNSGFGRGGFYDDFYDDYMAYSAIGGMLSGVSDMADVAASALAAGVMQSQDMQETSVQNKKSECVATFAYTAPNGSPVFKCECPSGISYQYNSCVDRKH